MNLARLIGKLDALTTGSFMDSIKRTVATEGLKLTATCFRTSTDPYGVAWPLLKTPRPGGPVEDKTGTMKDTMLAGPVAEGVRFYATVPYAKFQHWGTVTNPQRRLLPVGFLGLPASWSAMVARVYNGAAREVAA